MNELARYRDLETDGAGLLRAASRLLAASGPVQSDGRVTASPDLRALRYYQTLGLVRRPLRYDGRKAVYGYRHLLEILAVKLLQARGTPLALIQQALAGATTEALETAVVEGLGPATTGGADIATELDIKRPVPVATSSRALVAAEVAPGVVVTVDPVRVADPAAVLWTIRETLTKLEGGGA